MTDKHERRARLEADRQRRAALRAGDKNETASQEPDAATARPWLDELIARYGEPRVHAGPTPLGRMADSDGRYQRECWVWFPPPDLRNHNMALDQYEGHWMIRADGYPGCGHLGQARVRWPGADEPPAGVVRAALVSAGLLPAEHLSRQERAIGAVRKLHKGRINEDYPQEKPMCAECGEWSPCPTEQAIAKALAGEEGTDGS